MPLNLLLGRDGGELDGSASISVRGYRGTEVSHNHVLRMEAVGLTLAASAQQGDADVGCFSMLNHAKRTGRAERRLERAAALFFVGKHRSRHYVSQGLHAPSCIHDTHRALPGNI